MNHLRNNRTERVRRGVIRINGRTERKTSENIVSVSADTLINRTKGVSFTTNKYRKVVRAIAPQIGEVLVAPYERTIILPDHTVKSLKNGKAKRERLKARLINARENAQRG